MNKTTNVLLGMILVLLLLNLAMTTILVGKLPTASEVTDRLGPEVARAWGKNVVELYNRNDDAALYQLFNRQARIKISQQQLAGQLQKLRQLFFSARVSAQDNPATLKLSLIATEAEVSLYGLSVNASQTME